jgi:hypothetical protein
MKRRNAMKQKKIQKFDEATQAHRSNTRNKVWRTFNCKEKNNTMTALQALKGKT